MGKSAFNAEEKAAMRAAAREAKRASDLASLKADCLAAIEAMGPDDKSVALKFHQLVAKQAPDLNPKTWYGMPAYALNGDTVCFFQGAEKFKTRYHTIGFTHHAKIDDGNLWPTSFAVTKWDSKSEKALSEMLKKALG